MKIEEYTSLINNIVSKPDDAPNLAKTLLENIKADTELINSQTAKLQESDQRIRDLQNTNIKLFLQQTGQASSEDSDEKPIDPKELAKQIMEGK